ncbi:TonB family protein [Rhizobium sp. GR12]|uniref:TonB family protein n=1 Tax=Rhizobium sp. GR12 TaxID=3053925 RepID=UPI002FBD5D88
MSNEMPKLGNGQSRSLPIKKSETSTMRWILFGFLFVNVLGLASLPRADEIRLATKAEWVVEVRKRLVENLVVTVDSGSAGMGRPELKLIVLRDGTIKRIAISRSSGQKTVDDAVLRMAKRAGRLPPFSRDMKGKQEEVVVSVEIGVGDRPPTPDTTSKGETVYQALGFRLQLPEPFEIYGTRRLNDSEVFIDVGSRTSEPSSTEPSGRICTVGFDAQPPEGAPTQSQLNGDDVLLKKITSAYGRDPSLFGKTESVFVFEHDGVRGVAIITTPAIFDRRMPERRQYRATMVRPQGAVTVSCWATAKAMPHAIMMFQKVAEGTGLAN